MNDKAETLSSLSNTISSEAEYINSLIANALNDKISFAIWKLPHSSSIFFIADFSGNNQTKSINLEDSQGFIFSPFENNNENAFLIEADLLISLSEKKYSTRKEEIAEKFLDRVSKKDYKSISEMLPALTSETNSTSEDFKQIVTNAIGRIVAGEVKKIVVSRRKTVEQFDQFNFANAFLELCKDEKAFVSLIHIPEEGLWMGASPELLVCIDENKTFQTVSLAGTQVLKDDMDVSKAVWTQKEIEEQALVSRYIINCFKTIRLREFEEDGPRTVQAGNLIHLKTNFSVDMNEVGFPTLGTTMIKLLHPTSAVCGMPKDKAFDFLKANENIDRKFYSGFLGPVNIEKATNIFVNIRCAEFGKNKVSFYSGAGITQDSDPEKEFLETELKMKIMEKVVTSRP